MKSITVFGDSIAWGMNDPEKGGWVDRLKLFSDSEVYNLGISGNTSRDLLNRLEIELSARKTDVVVFAIGVNDSATDRSGINKVSFAEFTNNLKKIIHTAHEISPKMSFVGLLPVDEAKTLPVPWDADYFYTNKEIGRYNKAISTLCLEEGIDFIDLVDVLDMISDLDDGLHPNSEGHQKIFLRVKEKLFPR